MTRSREPLPALSLLLKTLMAERGMTAVDVAEAGPMGLSTVHSYLSGSRLGLQPHRDTMEAFARALRVDVTQLYDVIDQPEVLQEVELVRHFRSIKDRSGRTEAVEAVRLIAVRHQRRRRR